MTRFHFTLPQGWLTTNLPFSHLIGFIPPQGTGSGGQETIDDEDYLLGTERDSSNYLLNTERDAVDFELL